MDTDSHVSAPDIETVAVQAVRDHLGKMDQPPGLTPDRKLIEQYVKRVIIQSNAIEIRLAQQVGYQEDEQDQEVAIQHASDSAVFITVPWTKPAMPATKGVLHSPSPSPNKRADNTDILLTAIAKARAWIDGLVEGRALSFAEIAKREGKVERHIRLLAPLAFVSPRITNNIIDGVGPSITLTDFAKRMDYRWAKQLTD